MKPAETPLIRFHEVTKYFGPVIANDRVRFDVFANTVHGVVGENGAGKSTIMKILYGMMEPDSGWMEWKANRVRFRRPRDAVRLGIGMVHQHFMLVPTLTAWENIALDRQLPLGRLPKRSLMQRLENLKAEYGFNVPLEAHCEALPVGHQQQVEILKLLHRNADVLILDEPTAVLTPPEIEALMEQLRLLASRGKTCLLITHKLKEVLRCTQRITVMRAGKVISTQSTSEYQQDENRLAEEIVGRKLGHLPPRKQFDQSEVVLSVKQLTRERNGKRALDSLSFDVRSGEIVGIAGVEGNGQEELIECLVGTEPSVSGEILMRSVSTKGKSPREIRSAGLGVIPADRHRDAVLINTSVTENYFLGHLTERGLSQAGVVQQVRVRQATERMLEDFDVRPRDPGQRLGALSGGNQQKAVLGRELSRTIHCLVAAHPTRGVDIGATQFIHRRLLKLRDEGGAVLLISSELDEILALSDRILVLYEGAIRGEVERSAIKINQLGLWMTGSST